MDPRLLGLGNVWLLLGPRLTGRHRRSLATTGRPGTGAMPMVPTRGMRDIGDRQSGSTVESITGYGYFGTGFVGGYWSGGVFNYNTAVTNVNRTVIHNTFNRTVIHKGVVRRRSRVSFNGGRGGIHARPTSAQRTARRHGISGTAAQRTHQQIAARSRAQRASVNHGHPRIAAVQRSLRGTNRSGVAHGRLSASTHHHNAPVTSAHHNASVASSHHNAPVTAGRNAPRLTTHRSSAVTYHNRASAGATHYAHSSGPHVRRPSWRRRGSPRRRVRRPRRPRQTTAGIAPKNC